MFTKVRLLLVITLWLTGLSLNAQIHSNYSVIKVNGKVVSKILNRPIKSGDIVKAEDQLTFSTKESYIHVINAEGTKTIRNVPDNSPRELMQLMKTFLSPGKKNMSTRDFEKTKYERIKSVLKEDTIMILGDGKITIDTTDFPLHHPAGVKAKYSMLDEKVSLVISNESGYHLGKEPLFHKHPESKSFPMVTVVYYEDINDPIHKESVLLGVFTPIYPDEEELKKEVKIIVSSLKNSQMSPNHIIKEITGYLTTEYAATIPENVTAWLNANKLLD